MKSAQEVGIYNLHKILPVAIWKSPDCPSGRPPGRPANGHFSDRCASGRPPGRWAKAHGRPPPTREWGDLSRSTARSTDQTTWPLCTSRAHQSTGTVDQPLVRSTVRSTASAVRAGFWEFKFSLLPSNKSHKIT